MIKEALIVVDVQNDFCSSGLLAVPDAEQILLPVNQLIERHHHVILTQDWHPADHISFADNHPGRHPYETISLTCGDQILWPQHCVTGTQGADFHPMLATGHAGLILRKGCNPQMDSYSAFFENDRKTTTGLAAYLHERGLQKLVFCGLATDFCVAFSAIDAVKCGFQAQVILTACQPIDVDGSLGRALRDMRANGVDLTLSA
ncbi:MAG: Pyrazinamidase/nicotinamidase PncA [Candidatus Tokpelaia hoelldobleri]|uniref:Nicotinamidase n=1 Tax=Candidatus Tokpelaia hoelldobleri TaxID=1902579 RepID=A0A1U9JTF0_9HYPH|nr:MAG: Pyrazinamidase/nicotinamidase PncA [Candidatus Tokpelaia hoelldoblerii]